MPPSASEINRQLRAAQRKVEQDMRRQVANYNRQVEAANKKAVADYNRQVDAENRRAEAHNRKVIDDHNRAVGQHNRRADAHNKKVIDEINHRLAVANRPPVRYTAEDAALVERVQGALTVDLRDYDVFLSYARLDGADVAAQLTENLQALAVDVWFDALAIRPGQSQSLQMDQGLRKARAGVVILTPAYLAGRFWTERELGALLHKPTLIPVLHNVTFNDVKEYSGILPDLAGFQTASESISDIAAKIAVAVRPAEIES